MGVALSNPVGPVKAAASTDTLPLTKTVSGNTITLTWTPIQCLGYVLYEDGRRTSNSWDPAKASWKANYVQGRAYKVVAVKETASGSATG